MKPNLYLDIDGVLLGKAAPDSPDIILARHAEEFMEWALARFHCYWLSTQCKGDKSAVLAYLKPYCGNRLLSLLSQVRPTTFKTLKVETLAGEFFWLDDSPLNCEIAWLEGRALRDRWICVDTRSRPDDLLAAREALDRRLHWLRGRVYYTPGALAQIEKLKRQGVLTELERQGVIPRDTVFYRLGTRMIEAVCDALHFLWRLAGLDNK